MPNYLIRASAALLTTAALAMSTPASADPVHASRASAACSDGNTYDAVVAGHGYYLPALVTESTQVFKPVAFGEFTTTVRDPDGVAVFVDTAPAINQGGGNVLDRNPKTYLDCTVSLSAVVEDGFTVSVHGTVTGFLTPPGAST